MPTPCPRCQHSDRGCTTIPDGRPICTSPEPIPGWICDRPGSGAGLYSRVVDGPADAASNPTVQPIAEATRVVPVLVVEASVSQPEPATTRLESNAESCRATARQSLCSWLRRHGGQATARALQRSNGLRYPTAQAAESALDDLASVGLGEWTTFTPQGGGHTVRIFVLHEADESRVSDAQEMIAGRC